MEGVDELDLFIGYATFQCKLIKRRNLLSEDGYRRRV
jgi:hypothetical protein